MIYSDTSKVSTSLLLYHILLVKNFKSLFSHLANMVYSPPTLTLNNYFYTMWHCSERCSRCYRCYKSIYTYSSCAVGIRSSFIIILLSDIWIKLRWILHIFTLSSAQKFSIRFKLDNSYNSYFIASISISINY